MKKPQKNRTNGEGQKTLAMRVTFTHPTATAVAIAGCFNDWRPEVTPMLALGDGRWIKEVVLPPGIYEYCLVVDGKWLPDPLVKETVPNPYGGLNSILKVAECS
jgi:hypothetical protein